MRNRVALAPGMQRKQLQNSPASRRLRHPAPCPDALANGKVKGRTGGGEPLESSDHPPPKPKISNLSVPGEGLKLTKEQQEEVDAHNRDFDAKHDRAGAAPNDKVDKKFWTGGGSVN